MGQAPMLTKKGYETLKRELEELRAKKREISEAIREAKSHGDLRENAAYHEAKLNMDRVEGRIQDLEKLLLVAKIVERPEGADGVAHLGSKVRLEDLAWGDELEVTLVGSYEADPAHDLISISSPLGQALIGREVGEEVEVETPDGRRRYRLRALG